MITQNDFSKNTYTAENGLTLPYRLRVPKGEGPFPLLLCLHGAGERGSENEQQMVHFLPIFNHENSPAANAIALLPQCPAEFRWVEYGWEKGCYRSDEIRISRPMAALRELLDQVFQQLPVDKSRIYVTGLSMGGFGSWYMLANYPELFAAGMPICGAGAPDKADVLANIPIHTFHCADDNVVPPGGSREMAKAIEAQGKNNFTYTEFPSGGHDAWAPVYANSENVRWLFSHKK